MNRGPDMILRLLSFVAIVCLVGGGATERVRAQVTPSPEAVAAANELFAILSVDLMKQLTAQMTNLMWPIVEQKARAEKIDDGTIAELRQEFDRVQGTSMTEIMKRRHRSTRATSASMSCTNWPSTFYQTPNSAPWRCPNCRGDGRARDGHRTAHAKHAAACRAGFDQILRQHGYIK